MLPDSIKTEEISDATLNREDFIWQCCIISLFTDKFVALFLPFLQPALIIKHIVAQG